MALAFKLDNLELKWFEKKHLRVITTHRRFNGEKNRNRTEQLFH